MYTHMNIHIHEFMYKAFIVQASQGSGECRLGECRLVLGSAALYWWPGLGGLGWVAWVAAQA